MKNIVIIFLIFNSIMHAELIRPENDRELNYLHILFEWDQEPGAIGYNLQISNQSIFNNLLLDVELSSTIFIDKDNFNWDNNYYWRVRPVLDYEDSEYGDWIGINSFQIGDRAFQNLDIDIYNEELLEDGYVAIGGFNPGLSSAIIDRYGNEIWNDGGFQFQLNHINEHGNIYGFSVIDYPLNTGMKANFDMDVLWSTMDENNPVDTHVIKQIPNGNYMGFIQEYQLGPIASDNYMTQYFQMIGYEADGATLEFPWYGQKIVEWNENHEVVWSWNPFDHFSMGDYDNYEGTWYGAYFDQEFDWMHSNAFHFDDEESVIYVSHRHLSRITKISYPSGDVIWNMGLPVEYMASGNDHICTDLLFSFQHNIQLLEDGSLLFFDNGNLSEMLLGDSNPTSRIRRIKVIDDSYCDVVWEYELPQNLFGAGMGSVQLLDNGNYSIYTYGSGLNNPECSVIEITQEKDIIWKATGNQNTAWYRAYKIPSLHPEAFSVIVDDYITSQGENIVELTNDFMSFMVTNESGYEMSYNFLFDDLMDGGEIPLFDHEEGVIDLNPYESMEISFPINIESNATSTEIMLSIWPIHHANALKELEFSILFMGTVLGDLNSDGIINILDVVGVINMILGVTDQSLLGDLNSDGIINILDVVLMVNLILAQ